MKNGLANELMISSCLFWSEFLFHVVFYWLDLMVGIRGRVTQPAIFLCLSDPFSKYWNAIWIFNCEIAESNNSMLSGSITILFDTSVIEETRSDIWSEFRRGLITRSIMFQSLFKNFLHEKNKIKNRSICSYPFCI